jgi:acyl-CoA synthetase (AMP-forming)/AMP-acid ligase II
MLRAMVPEVLAERAAAHPGRPAIRVEGGDRLTYGALDRRANRLARALHAAGADPGRRVAVVCCDAHAPDLLVAVVAAWRAGTVAAVVAPGEPAMVASAYSTLAPSVTVACSDGVRAWKDAGIVGRLLGDSPDVTWWRAAELRQPPDPLEAIAGADDPAEAVLDARPGGGWSVHTLTHAQVAARCTPRRGLSSVVHAVPLASPDGRHGATLGPLTAGMSVLMQVPFSPVAFHGLLARADTACLLAEQVAEMPSGSTWVDEGALRWWSPADSGAEGGLGIAGRAG